MCQVAWPSYISRGVTDHYHVRFQKWPSSMVPRNFARYLSRQTYIRSHYVKRRGNHIARIITRIITVSWRCPLCRYKISCSSSSFIRDAGEWRSLAWSSRRLSREYTCQTMTITNVEFRKITALWKTREPLCIIAERQERTAFLLNVYIFFNTRGREREREHSALKIPFLSSSLVKAL